MLTHQPLDPRLQSLICSIAALAAEAAEDDLRAAMIAAPLCYTVGMNCLLYQSRVKWLLMSSLATWVYLVSGNIVEEWLPQIITCSTADTGFCTYSANQYCALLWSSLVIAVKFLLSSPCLQACFIVIKALVLAGLPTTRILHPLEAFSPIAQPVEVNILPFSLNRSPLSIPGPLGLAPTNNP